MMENLDLLQNIEFAIVSVYKADDALRDKNVIKALDELVTYYQKKGKGQEYAANGLSDLEARVFEAVIDILNIRDENSFDVKTYIAAILKIKNSAKRWTKRIGIRGYLNFVSSFF